MSNLQQGAETIIHQCLNVQPNETVVLLDDGNDVDLIRVLKEEIENTAKLNFFEYPQLEKKLMSLAQE